MAAKKKAKKKAAKRGTAKKAAKKGGKKKAPSGEVLLVGSKVKAAIKAAGCNTGGDAIGGLNDWVGFLLGQATKRAKANGRKTVRAHDFILS